jgi:FtsZ-interacting cell division protein ZipA
MVELKRKVTIRRKEAPEEPKKAKCRLWLWLLLAIVAIAVVIFVVVHCSSNANDKIVTEKIEQAIAKVNEIVPDLQNENVNFEEAQAKVDEAQKAVDEAKANATTEANQQAVEEAQAKVDEARQTVEQKKAAAETESKEAATSETDEQPVTPVETTKQAGKESATTSKPTATLPQGTLEEKARRVIRGDFGNGADRKKALGSEYREIQSKVNEMYRNGQVY